MALDPVTLMSLIQGGVGLAQMAGGAATKAGKRPEYSPSAATQEAVNITSQEANSSYPPSQVHLSFEEKQ